MIEQIFTGILFVLFSFLWIRAASKENGEFSKKETVQLLLGGAFCLILYSEVTGNPIDWAKWLITLGSLIVSVAIKALETIKQK